MKKIIYILLILSFTYYSCEDLEVKNLNSPDAERALNNPSDIIKLLEGGNLTFFKALVAYYGVHYQVLADQYTTTMDNENLIAFSNEPRQKIPNNKNNDGVYALYYPLYNFSNCIFTANIILELIDNGKKIIIETEGEEGTEEVDKTKEVEAVCYFLKGVSLGYIGAIFDKGFIVNYDTDIDGIEFSNYKEVLEEGLKFIDKSIELTSQIENFSYTYMRKANMDKSRFLQMCNSYAARILISKPRTKAEAETLDYQRVVNYAKKGFTEDFYIETTPNVFYSVYVDWCIYNYWDGSAYIPLDIKVCKLIDNSFPNEYPLDEQTMLGTVSSSDSRINNYYGYTTKLRYLDATVNRSLFSNYKHMRFRDEGKAYVAGFMNPMFLKSELQLILAECYYKTGDLNTACNYINATPRVTEGNMPLAKPTDDIEHILHYEYSIELDLASSFINPWTFMRRNDLLQKGTALHMPLPAYELDNLGIREIYTFGGYDFSFEEGTASTDGWKAKL